jgi:hypothetical protein
MEPEVKEQPSQVSRPKIELQITAIRNKTCQKCIQYLLFLYWKMYRQYLENVSL